MGFIGFGSGPGDRNFANEPGGLQSGLGRNYRG
jgi:hypothetical protein